MAKATGKPKKAKVAASAPKKKEVKKLGLLKSASKQVADAAAKLVKAATKMAPKPAAAKAAKPAPAAKGEKPAAAAKGEKPAAAAKAEKPAAAAKAEKPAAAAAKSEKPAAVPAKAGKAAPAKEAEKAAEKPAAKGPKALKGKAAAEQKAEAAAAAAIPYGAPPPGKPHPRATKLPPAGEPLTKREMEQLLTAGQGRGVFGEGSLKGKLIVKESFPYLSVVGRDKRELTFLLQGPDQEVLPAYVEHKVSVSGMIRKTTNYGGTVDVRKYSAKKPEAEVAAPEPEEQKLKFLSPGEVEQVCAAGMGAGMRGFGALRGNLEMTGEEFFLVVSGGGTRQQVSFIIAGKASKGLKKYLGQGVQVTGSVDKSSGWGGTIQAEVVEPRPTEAKAMSRDNLEVVTIDNLGSEREVVEVKINTGLSVTLPEKAGHTWAIEPTTAKRVGLREANYMPSSNGPATREFFFTPRNPGTFDVDFFLAKALTPAQVAKTCGIALTVKP